MSKDPNLSVRGKLGNGGADGVGGALHSEEGIEEKMSRVRSFYSSGLPCNLFHSERVNQRNGEKRRTE